jgi:hypothetical protein
MNARVARAHVLAEMIELLEGFEEDEVVLSWADPDDAKLNDEQRAACHKASAWLLRNLKRRKDWELERVTTNQRAVGRR